jgi:membrane peptidoglycan carboxypeptidase
MVRRIYQKKVFQKNKKNIIFAFLKISGIILCLFLFIGILLFILNIKDLPRPEKFNEGIIPQSTKIYDRDGDVLLYEIAGKEKRTLVSLSEIPDNLKWAVISTEDKNFYKHQGIDVQAILRAILIDLKIRKPLHGASTITQQLIRSYFLTTKKTLKRKTQEITLTLELERRYSKDQILEWYLNLIPFGSNLYGVEATSQTFFGKHISDITLEEAALMAAIIRAPTYFWPQGEHIGELLSRKDYVLERMKILGYITEEQEKEAREKEIKFVFDPKTIKAPHFVIYVKSYLENKYGRDYLDTAGLKVYTTLDAELQEKAEEIVKNGVDALKIYDAHNGALVSINAKTGDILAMVGSKDWYGESEECSEETNQCKFDPKVNVGFSLRQPGSAFKPIVYLDAFSRGYTPETLIWNVATEFNPDCSPDANQEYDAYNLECYHPRNYSDRFTGLTNLRNALAQSVNLPAVKVLYLTGVRNSLDLAKKLGITTLEDEGRYGLSLVLGGGEVKLIEMVGAYSVFANNGIKKPLNFIKKIEDNNGNIIEQTKTSESRVVSSQIVKQLNSILSDNEARAPIFGYNSVLNFKDYDVAVKTGTTQFLNNAWAIGYTPSIVTGVWVGNNDNSPTKKPGVTLAGSIWRNFMNEILKEFPKESFEKPEENMTEKPILNGEQIEPHSILHYIKKEDPLGPSPENPSSDPQYFNWEYSIQKYISSH